MIDYTAAGFTLLQERICMRRKIGEFAMSSSLTAKLSPLPVISLLMVAPDCTVVDLSGRILCPVLLINTFILIGGGGEAGPRRARRKWR